MSFATLRTRTTKPIILLLIILLALLGLLIFRFRTASTDRIATKALSPLPWRAWNVTGVEKLAVVCVEFSDVDHTESIEVIDMRLHQMEKYFRNVSFGKISIDFLLVDHWERLNNTMSYYGNGTEMNDARSWTFVVDTVTVWHGLVNFTDYTSLMIVHSGQDQAANENETQLLWSRNNCSLGRSSKLPIKVGSKEYSFWGMAYVSESDEYGVMAHEFGHTLGLPDLYVKDEMPFDDLSLMARGDWNGEPRGTCPAPLDGFCMSLLGWLNTRCIVLNSTEVRLEINTIGSSHATLLRISVSERKYYLIEAREESGNDPPTVVIYLIDAMKQTMDGIATLPEGGKLTSGSRYVDQKGHVLAFFSSYNPTTHSALVSLSASGFFVELDVPDLVSCFSVSKGSIQAFDMNGNPAQDLQLNISFDNRNPLQVLTDQDGEADFELKFGLNSLGSHSIAVASEWFLTGEKEKTFVVIVPQDFIVVVALLILCMMLGFFLVHSRKKLQRMNQVRPEF